MSFCSLVRSLRQYCDIITSILTASVDLTTNFDNLLACKGRYGVTTYEPSKYRELVV